MATEYKPLDFLEYKCHPKPGSALVILNQPIASEELLGHLWECTDYHLCADGGANRLLDCLNHDESTVFDPLEYLPDTIHGDLDSLRDDVRTFYERYGVEVTKDPDQYSTDFGKAMKKVAALPSHGTQDVVILGTISGRVDQGLGLLHEMYREQLRRSHLRLWLFSEISISFILAAGEHVVHTPMSEGLITPNIGIVPIFGPSKITTEGLEWDVKDWETNMGGQVSTSNHIVGHQVAVRTESAVLFTMERREFEKIVVT
ncbi:thiamine pyrophosphokinase [Elasticomyces elasticus]|nr:thiamine pyrophosphokinase [Elasticomyces elasticus]